MKRGSKTVIPYNDIDYELRELIRCINDINGIETTGCCCGHGKAPCVIWFEADSIEDVTHFIYKYLYHNSLWKISINLTDIDIDNGKWNNPTYFLETTCTDYYYTGVCIDNLVHKIKKEKTVPITHLTDCANAGYYCPLCNKKILKEEQGSDLKKIKFCFNCGAKIDGEVTP